MTRISIRRERRGRVNKPPVVYAGPDRAVKSLENVALKTAVADELDVSGLTVTWSKVSGPGRVDFSNAKKPQTSVTFSKRGTYTLRLGASDGEFEGTDEVTIRAGIAVR